MLIIGITGPSGAGKSLFCSFLEEAGARILDCDKIYHNLINEKSGCTEELSLEENFGPGILNEKGGVDRKKLAAVVFAEGAADKLLLLNKISHRHVTLEINRIIESETGKNNPSRAIIIDAPLLIEAGMKDRCNVTLALLAGRSLRFKRLTSRDNIGAEALDARLNAAKDDDFYIRNCDVTIVNEGDVEELKNKALKFLSDTEAGL